MPDYHPNPSGKCFCGCGGDAPIAANTIPRHGHVKGRPLRYIKGHQLRKGSPARKPQVRGEGNHNFKSGRSKNGAGYVLVLMPEHHRANASGYVLVAEKATGLKILSHHVNDNTPSNLVICEDELYHMLIHRRKNALASCGDVNGVCCSYCKEYDLAENMYVYKNRTGGYHKKCYNEQRKARKIG